METSLAAYRDQAWASLSPEAQDVLVQVCMCVHSLWVVLHAVPCLLVCACDQVCVCVCVCVCARVRCYVACMWGREGLGSDQVWVQRDVHLSREKWVKVSCVCRGVHA